MQLHAVWCMLLWATLVLGDKGETDLRENLRRNYDRAALPALKNVVTITSFKILDFDMAESQNTMNVLCWFGYTWNDPRLQWKKEDYQNIDRLAMDPITVWRPDISLYNSANYEHLPESNLPVLVFSTGVVLHVPAYTLHLHCLMDLTYWPHDSHNCTLKVGSWVHHGHILDIQTNGTMPELMLKNKTLASGQVITNAAWTISDLNMVRESNYYPCCEEPYVSATISMIVKRDAPAFAWVVKAPVICVSLLTFVVFLLPPSAGEKIVFGGLCLVINVLFIDYTSSWIGHAPSHTPLIIQLVCQQMVLVMLSVLVSAIVINISRGPHSSGLPTFLRRPALLLSSCLCLGHYNELASKPGHSLASSSKNDEVELGEDSVNDLRSRRERSDSHEWLLLAAVIDRLFLLLYVAICVISLIRFSSVL